MNNCRCPLVSLPAKRYYTIVSTVTEIKRAAKGLPQRQKVALVRWLQTQIDDRPTDDELMALAAEGAQVLDRREAADAKPKTR